MRAAPRAVQNSRSSSSCKFTAAHRLLRKDGFDHVVCAESIADGHFKIFFVRNNKKNARLGIVIGKKTLPGAADRNRVKRAIREVFRQHGVSLRKLDLVVMAKRAGPREYDMRGGNLKMLLSRVESRCAES